MKIKNVAASVVLAISFFVVTAAFQNCARNTSEGSNSRADSPLPILSGVKGQVSNCIEPGVAHMQQYCSSPSSGTILGNAIILLNISACDSAFNNCQPAKVVSISTDGQGMYQLMLLPGSYLIRGDLSTEVLQIGTRVQTFVHDDLISNLDLRFQGNAP